MGGDRNGRGFDDVMNGKQGSGDSNSPWGTVWNDGANANPQSSNPEVQRTGGPNNGGPVIIGGRATYGGDVGTTTSGMQQSDGNWSPPQNPNFNNNGGPVIIGGRATYGGDVGTTTRGMNGQESVPQWPPQNPQYGDNRGYNSGGQQAVPDWKDYASQRQNTQAQPGMPGSQGSRSVVNDQQRGIIAQSLNRQTDLNHYVIEAGIVGAGMNSAIWALDHYSGKIAPEERTGWAKTWRENYSPMRALVAEQKTALKAAEAAHVDILAKVAPVQAEVHAAMPAVSAFNDALSAKVAPFIGQADSAVPVEIRIARAQQAFITSKEAHTMSGLEAQTGTASEVALGQKLFTASEAAQLAPRAQALGKLADLTKAQEAAQAKVASATEAVLKAERAEGPGLGKAASTGLAKGLLIGAGLTAFDHLLDKGLSVPGKPSWYAEGIALPLTLMADIPLKWKIPLAGTVILGSKLLDKVLPAPSTDYSTLMRPNSIETLGITAAALAPVDAKWKWIGVGASWGAGRLWNLFAAGTGIDGNNGQQLNSDTTEAVKADVGRRTDSTFESIVKKGTKLGKENEAALELQMADFQQNHANDHPLNRLRGTAGLAAAVGNMWLDYGTKTDLTKHNKEGRLLEGSNLDLGGQATSFLRLSAGSLVEAQNYAMQHKGEEVNGKQIDDREVQDLQKSLKSVEDKLKAVYGEHDIDGIFKTLKDNYRANEDALNHFGVNLKAQVDGLRTNDPQYKAKMCRDVALLFMSIADYKADKNNGGDAAILYSDAQRYLTQAGQLDGNAPDQRKLLMIADRMRSKVPQAVQNQYNNHFDNPFSVPNTDNGNNPLSQPGFIPNNTGYSRPYNVNPNTRR